MSDKGLTEHLREFKEHAPDWFQQQPVAQQNYRFFRDFLRKENLEQAEWKDFQAIGDHIHSFHSMAIAKTNALGKPNHPIEHYRKSFIYLAHGDDPPEVRLRNFLHDKQYALMYFGNSAASELFSYVFADRFVMFNKSDQYAAKLLGITPRFVKGDKFEDKFLNFNKAIQPVIERYASLVGQQTDLPIALEVDQFFRYLYKTYHEDDPVAQQRCWLMAPGEQAMFWETCVEQGVILFGADQLPDLNTYKSKQAIATALKDASEEKKNAKQGGLAAWQFSHEMKVGDLIFAKKGRKEIIGYGKITSDYYHDETRSTYRNVRKVEWLKFGNWAASGHAVLPTKTLTEMTNKQAFLDWIMPLVETEPDPKTEKNCWWLNANPKEWDISAAAEGEVNTYTTHNDKGNKRQKYKHFQAVKPGDLVIGYVTSPKRHITTICEITKGLHQRGEDEVIEFKVVSQLQKPVPFRELKTLSQLTASEPLSSHQGSLFRLTAQEYAAIQTLIGGESPPPPLLSGRFGRSRWRTGVPPKWRGGEIGGESNSYATLLYPCPPFRGFQSHTDHLASISFGLWSSVTIWRTRSLTKTLCNLRHQNLISVGYSNNLKQLLRYELQQSALMMAQWRLRMNSRLSVSLFAVIVGTVLLSGCQDDGDNGDMFDFSRTNYGAGASNVNVTVKNDLSEPVTTHMYNLQSAEDMESGTARRAMYFLEPNQQLVVPLGFKRKDIGADVGYNIVFERDNSKTNSPLNEVGSVPIYSDNPQARSSQVTNWHEGFVFEELGVAR